MCIARRGFGWQGGTADGIHSASKSAELVRQLESAKTKWRECAAQLRKLEIDANHKLHEQQAHATQFRIASLCILL